MSEGIIIAVVGVVGAVLAALITRSGSRVEGRLERVERDVEAFGERLERIGDRFDRLAADLGARIDRLFEVVAGMGPDEGVQARRQEAQPGLDELSERLTQAMATALGDFRAAWTRELQGALTPEMEESDVELRGTWVPRQVTTTPRPKEKQRAQRSTAISDPDEAEPSDEAELSEE